jgi:hypothetical protein
MLGHHETVKLLAEKGATMMTNGINLTNGMGKFFKILLFLVFVKNLNRLFMFTSCLCMESIRSC